jgi:hypothetical protein
VSSLTRLSEWLLRQPAVWGGLASMAFYALVVERAEPGSLVATAFTGNQWQFKAAASLLCFAGLAALAMRLLNLAVQFGALERRALPPAPAGGQDISDVGMLLAELDSAPSTIQSTSLARRLRRALDLVEQRGSADGIETDLRALADEDRDRVASRYATLRLTAVCIPLIGVAGAAAGIAIALGGLAGKPIDAALPDVLAGAGLACGGVLQAAALTIVLLFAKLGVQRVEQRLLAAVDESVNKQLLGRFVAFGMATDPGATTIQRMSEKVLATVEAAAERREAEATKSLSAVSRRWEEMAATAGSSIHRSVGEAVSTGLQSHADSIAASVARLAADLQTTLVRHAEILSENIDQHTGALADALEHHTVVIAETEKSIASENQRHLADMHAVVGEAMLVNANRQEKLIRQSEDLLKEMQVALVEAAGTTVAQQEQLIKQSDVLLKVVDATGQIRKLEEALNGNLHSLAASHNFEQTVTSLAAAVQLLSVRLRQPAIVRNGVDLSSGETTSQAA